MSVEAYCGESASGPVFDAAATYPARVEPVRRLVRSTSDDVVGCEALAYLRPDVSIATGDRVTVAGRVYRVLRVEPLVGLLRTEGLRVELGRSET